MEPEGQSAHNGTRQQRNGDGLTAGAAGSHPPLPFQPPDLRQGVARTTRRGQTTTRKQRHAAGAQGRRRAPDAHGATVVRTAAALTAAATAAASGRATPLAHAHSGPPHLRMRAAGRGVHDERTRRRTPCRNVNQVHRWRDASSALTKLPNGYPFTWGSVGSRGPTDLLLVGYCWALWGLPLGL